MKKYDPRMRVSNGVIVSSARRVCPAHDAIPDYSLPGPRDKPRPARRRGPAAGPPAMDRIAKRVNHLARSGRLTPAGAGHILEGCGPPSCACYPKGLGSRGSWCASRGAPTPSPIDSQSRQVCTQPSFRPSSSRASSTWCGAARRRPLGADRLAQLRPQSDPRKVAQLLAATSEGVRFNELAGGFALSASSDLAAILAQMAVEGRALEPLRLLALADFLERVEATREAIRRTDGHFPILKTLAEGGAAFRERDRRDAPQDRAVRRGGRQRQPGAARASASGCGGSGRASRARSSRSCATRTPRSTCRTRSSPTATGASCSSCAPSTGCRSRASCTAARRAAPASSSSR